MTTMRTLLALSLLTTLGLNAQTFRPEAIRGHMRFLAHDLLEGRGTGSRGYQVAAEYVAAQFEAAGLAPGANGSWFQKVPFRKTTALPESEVTIAAHGAPPVTLRFGEGFVTTGDPLQASRVIEGAVVVAGYGVTAPELQYDDYAGIDVRGKIVAIFSGAPSAFPNTLRAHYSSSVGKIDNAAAHGAAGVVTLQTPTDMERAPWDRVVRQSRLGAMHWLESSGAPHAVRSDISSTIGLSAAGMRTLFSSSPRGYEDVAAELAAGKLRAFELPVRMTVRIVSAHENIESPNVAGILRGSDPVLRDQYIVYSSHLDHLGISDPVDGDAINNGALDNASGIAAMIEIARAFGGNPPPRRSILFLATTGEEKGLRGADYFASNPTVPARQLVGNINIDEILMMHAVKDVVAFGVEVSSLGDMARKVAQGMGLEVSPDPYPEEVIFVRSDQYPFVKAGVPAIFVVTGYKAVDPNIDSVREQIEWIKTVYHTPKDDLSQKLDYSVGATLARFNYLLGLEAASSTAAPAWTPGNFFGEKFGRGQ